MAPQKYKILEDVAIADIAYEAYGKDIEELFENAAFAIFELSADIETFDAKKKLEFKLESSRMDNLLYDFLSEIIFLKDSKYMIFKKIKVSINKGKTCSLNAVMWGDKINPKKQGLKNDIKAITLHMFELKKEKNGYEATIVVDI